MFAGHSAPVTCGAFTPDGKTIVTASDDAALRTWNPRTGACIHTVQGYPFHTAGITCIDLDASCSTALTASQDGTAKLVSLSTGKVSATLIGHTCCVEAAGLCDSAPFAATGGHDGVARIWDVPTASVRCTLDHHIEASMGFVVESSAMMMQDEGASPTVSRLQWIAGSQQLVTATTDGRVRLWDGRSGQCVRVWHVHSDAVLDLWVGRVGGTQTIATAGEDGTACIIHVT